MNTLATRSPWARLVAYGEENRFGLICFALILVGCLGGITMELGAFQHTGLMILVLIPTMTTLSLLLAVSPVRWILIAFATAILVDLVVGTVLVL